MLTSRSVMRSQLDSLPDELLELILQHAQRSLRAYSDGDCDILHRAAAWSSLAGVNRRYALAFTKRFSYFH